MKILDLGCGSKKTVRDGAIVVGVDNIAGSQADIVHDLNQFPYPLESDAFDEIICQDVLEHLENIPDVMKEIHRVGKKGALVKIRSPHFSSIYAHLDPTHVHSFSILSFDCFCKNKRIIPHNIESDLFIARKRKIIFPKLTRTILRPVAYLANKFPLRYEQYFAYLFQAENAYWELEILK